MAWPWLVVFLLGYALIGAVTAHVAYTQMWANLIDLGDRDGGIRAVWALGCCLGLCLLIGAAWLIAIPAWAARRRTALN